MANHLSSEYAFGERVRNKTIILTKAAIIGLTKNLVMNFAPVIIVNAIAPGLAETDMLKNLPDWRLEE